MADTINTMRKVVVSTTLTSSDWHDTTVIGSGVAATVAALKQEDGGPVVVAGSRTLVHFLLAEGLVDELHLQVFPVVLGSGARFYPESEARTDLALVSARPLGTGVLLLSYAVPATGRGQTQ